MRKPRKVDLLAPPLPTRVLIVQLHLSGAMADRVRVLMQKYGLEQAAVVRMLLVDGLEARDGRLAS